MSNFLSILPEGGWQRLVCDVLWQSSLIGVAGLFVVRFCATIGNAGLGAIAHDFGLRGCAAGNIGSAGGDWDTRNVAGKSTG